jgi:transposase-like protein
VAGAAEAGEADPRGPGAVADQVAEVARLVEAGASTRDAVSEVARASGHSRRALYQAVLNARSAGAGSPSTGTPKRAGERAEDR